MITRKFEQEWEQSVSTINNRIEKNVIFDFFDYMQDMHKDLKAIKKDYEKAFNKFSKKSIDYYIKLFEKRREQYASICIENHRQTGSIGHIQSYEDFRKDIVNINGNHHKINDKYYPVLKKIAESIFEIEEKVAPIVEKFWIEEFSKIENYSKNGNYFLLAHTSLGTMTDDELPKEISSHLKNQKGMCFSVVTDQKTRLYDGPAKNYYHYSSSPTGFVGIIARPKPNSIVGISFDDMLSTEYIDGKCPLPQTFHHSNVNSTYCNENSNICCRGTKICPPKEIFNISVDTINEIILDKTKMDVEAVFYVKNTRNEIPDNFEEYKKRQEEICGHPLKTIELTLRNRLKQVDLEELYDM